MLQITFVTIFQKIGLKLASKISSHDDNAFKTYLVKNLSSSLFLCPTVQLTLKYCKKLIL